MHCFLHVLKPVVVVWWCVS